MSLNPIQPFLLFACLSLALVSCRSGQSGQAGSDCQTRGVLVDRRDLAGCQFLIQLDDGRKLLPMGWPDKSFEPSDGLLIYFDFEPAPDMSSICMAEDEIVQVTCLRAEVPVAADCVDADRIEEVMFLSEALVAHDPDEVVKYRYRSDGWMYLFRGKKIYLYDCQGTLICEQDDPNEDRCAALAEPGSKGQVIWKKP